jgi:hypothetical protein
LSTVVGPTSGRTTGAGGWYAAGTARGAVI